MQCVVFTVAQAEPRFKWCVQYSDRNKECAAHKELEEPVTCENAGFWRCGCMNANMECGTASCECSGDPDFGGLPYVVNHVCVQSGEEEE